MPGIQPWPPAVHWELSRCFWSRGVVGALGALRPAKSYEVAARRVPAARLERTQRAISSAGGGHIAARCALPSSLPVQREHQPHACAQANSALLLECPADMLQAILHVRQSVPGCDANCAVTEPL